MLLNGVVYAMMNNPLREAIQRRFGAPRLLRLGGPMQRGHALEIGCGRGVGTELILDLLGANAVDAFDLDPSMVMLARERLRPRGKRVRLWVGDASTIAAPDACYDAVFDFGIIHHVPDWRRAPAEVRRVLGPHGRFYAEEVLAPRPAYTYSPVPGRFLFGSSRAVVTWSVRNSPHCGQESGGVVLPRTTSIAFRMSKRSMSMSQSSSQRTSCVDVGRSRWSTMSIISSTSKRSIPFPSS
jgi:ubiquinone/menaquinone biosynthesis C-methylase UbiE